MLRPVKDLKGYALLATDGPIGHVVDVLVDDRHWAVRYLVVDTGTWLSGRRVLISPMSLGRPDWALQQLPVSLTKDRVEHSPDVDTQKPVSRQHEEEQLSYYGYPVYWEGPACGARARTRGCWPALRPSPVSLAFQRRPRPRRELTARR